MNSPKLNPYIILLIGVISISTSAIFVKLASAPSGIIAFYRLFFTVLFMLPLFVWKYISELKLISKKDWFFSILSGVFLAFHFILWFESLRFTSVASSTVLVTLQPLFAFVGSYLFFKEVISGKALLSCMLAIGGSVIISWGDFYVSGTALYGDLLALIACALVTIYFMFGQTVRKRISLITYTFVVYFISTVTLLIYVLLKGEPLFSYSSKDWIYFILLAIFPTLLGHSLFNWSLKWLNTSTISMAVLLEPVGAGILAYFLLQETITWTQALGSIIVISGIMFFLVDEKKTKMKSSSINNNLISTERKQP
ncbi:DMT family transporter [Niallia endozanthoxylica]|uniref:DMT family transporter n=1 Tax=Niallia endozanthoxylica TaxID=2036016 RepID=A0A5J5H0D2_9BACI|nr:DMT family transporter [Niallia endozanthoxylica]KAA9014066.1 DMT family transporter [Niallia endozanthoxylica]